MEFKKYIKTYYNLAKPGIIYANSLTAAAGFLLASNGHIDGWRLAATLAGISLLIGSACVFNNLLDRNIDKLMARTAKRALVTGVVRARFATIYAVVLAAATEGLVNESKELFTTAI